MKQVFFFLLLLVFTWISFNRPVYELPGFYKSFNDFENVIGWSKGSNANTISDEKAYSKTYSSKLDCNLQYSYIYEITGSQLPSNEVVKMRVKARIYSDADPKNLTLVVQYQHENGELFLWLPRVIKLQRKKWNLIDEDLGIYKKLEPTDKVAALFWNNKGQEIIYIDDMQIEFY